MNPDLEAYRDRVVEQLRSWVKGTPVHNHVDDECCPDFSCCNPGMLDPDPFSRKRTLDNYLRKIDRLEKIGGAVTVANVHKLVQQRDEADRIKTLIRKGIYVLNELQFSEILYAYIVTASHQRVPEWEMHSFINEAKWLHENRRRIQGRTRLYNPLSPWLAIRFSQRNFHWTELEIRYE